MKPTDKCENCGLTFREHCKLWRETPYNKINCKTFKSHSQKLLSKEQSTVRTSEEVYNRQNYSSSVSYTPLTKDKITNCDCGLSYCFRNSYREEYVLSALNGLREDDNIELFNILNILLHSNINKNVKEEIMNKIEILLNNKKKWFPILNDEVEK